MSQQGSLRFDRTGLLESLWTGLPAQDREQVVVLFAGLIARSTRNEIGRPAASQRLVGRATSERVNAVLGGEAPATGSPDARGDSQGVVEVVIAASISTDPNEVLIR